MVIEFSRRLSKSLTVVAIGLAISNCGGGSDDSDDGDSVDEQIDNALSAAFPTGLSLSVFPNSTTASALLEEDAVPTVKAEKDETIKMMNGKADSCLPPAFARMPRDGGENCYEFDQEMIYGQRQGTYYGTTNGKNEAGEACLPAFARGQVSDIKLKVDRALNLSLAALCQIKKNGDDTTPPEVGEEKDLKPALVDAMGDKADSITSATLSREEDVALVDGTGEVFKTEIVMTDKEGRERSVNIYQVVTDKDKGLYEGKFWFKEAGGNDNGGKVHMSSIKYARFENSSGDLEIKAELKSAGVNTVLADDAFVNGELDFNTGANFSVNENDNAYGNYSGTGINQNNDAFGNMTYVALNIKDKDSSGKVSYWKNPGANFNENARGMVFELTADADGKLSGCGTSGAASAEMGNAISIRKTIKKGLDPLKAQGFFHPFFNDSTGNGTDATGSFFTKASAKWYKPNLSDDTIANTFSDSQHGDSFSKQCVTQNADGVYEIDTAQTTEDAGYEVTDDAAESVAGLDVSDIEITVE